MTALVRYHLELQLRSYGYLPPFLAYVLLLVLGVSPGDEPLATCAYGSAVLLPVTVWLVRGTVAAEPPAARACLVAAQGAARVQLAALLAAFAAALTLGLAGWAGMLAITVRGAKHPVEVALVGLVALLVCVLLGLLAGALCGPPVLARAQYGIPVSLVVVVLLLVLPASPGNVVVRALITGGRTGVLHWPTLALLETAVLAAAAVALSMRRAVGDSRAG
jgi:hypothetical protein